MKLMRMTHMINLKRLLMYCRANGYGFQINCTLPELDGERIIFTIMIVLGFTQNWQFDAETLEGATTKAIKYLIEEKEESIEKRKSEIKFLIGELES